MSKSFACSVTRVLPGATRKEMSGRGVRKETAEPDSTEGSRSSPLNNVACLFIVIGLLRRCCSCCSPVLRAVAVGNAPTVGANSKRISLVADVALIFDPTSAGPARCSFCCSRPGRGANPVACPLQKNQLAAPPPSCRCFAGAVTSCSYCGICLLLLLCH